MNSKQRVLKAFNHEEPDRVPINYEANPEIDLQLKQHFRLSRDNDEGLRQALGVDFRMVHAPYIGPQLHLPPEGGRVTEFGAPMRWVEVAGGGYWDYDGWPLKDADLAQVKAWPMPSPKDYDYEALKRGCDQHKDFFVMIGGRGVGDVINQTGMLRSMEQVLLDLVTDDPAGLHLIERRIDVQYETMKRTIEAVGDKADMFLMGEDLGSQRGPLLSLDLFRQRIRPHLQRFVDLARSNDLPVMMHSDGSVDWVYEDLIEMGITVVDAVQIECANMEAASLKARFGDRLSFHGVWPTTGALSEANVEQTVTELREVLQTMMPGGGFAVCPAHQIQSKSPLENVIAAYEAIHTYGQYGNLSTKNSALSN